MRESQTNVVSLTGVEHNPTARHSRLKVAIVAESFLPHVNGVTNSVLRVAEYMTSRGHLVEIIAPGPGDPSFGSVPVRRMPSIPLPFYRGMTVGYSQKAVRAALESFAPDIVHLASPTVLGRAALIACESLGIPVVAIYQTDLAGFANAYGPKFVGLGAWKLLTSIHKRADLTLAPSTAAVWDLRQRGVGNVKRWMRGVDLERFNPNHRDEQLRQELAPNGETIVGYVGRLAREKQIERLESICELQNVKVVIVGDGPSRQRLERKLPNAQFVGFQSGIELSRYFASLDVFVHTGTDETFCQAIQEALSSGVPVVAPASGGPFDLVKHGHNGFLWSPISDVSLTGAVEELVRNRVKRDRLAANARDSVIERPWPTIMDELEGHYFALTQGLAFAYSELSA